MSLKVYYDLLSQPARAVVLFCKVNRIPFTPKPIALRKYEQHSEEYGRINPFHKVPAIQDGDFKLTESVAILQYLAEKYKVPDHWYPRDLRARSKVQSFMSWQHLNLRLHCATVFIHEVILPKATGAGPDEDELQQHVNTMHATLTTMEDVFLKDTPYLCGDKISIADLLGISEVLQATISGRNVTSRHPRLAAWVDHVKAELQPHFDEVFAILYRARDNHHPQAKL